MRWETLYLAGVELGELVSVSEVVGGSATGIASGERSIGGGMAPGDVELSIQLEVAFATGAVQ